MSDCITKIIPANPYSHIAPQILQEAGKYLTANFMAEDITSVLYDTPVFIDCGGNLEEIKCPICGAALDFDWWGEEMDKASETGFADMAITTPCCHKNSSLNDLKYYFPCGFACAEIKIHNPTSELDDNTLKVLQEMIGEPIRIIYSHL